VAPTHPSGPPTSRLWEIEGLRAVAAWSIVIFHIWVFTSPAVFGWNLGPLTPFVSPLQSGVTLFFVLSGFLLYRPVAAALLDGQKGPATLAYLRNRALRILPAYLVVLLIVGFVLRSASLGISGDGVVGGPLSEGKTLVWDIFLLQTYVPDAIWSGILPAWSLTIEVAFYVLLPLLALTAAWLGRGPALGRRRVAAAAGPPVVMLLLGGLGKTLVAVLSDGSQRADVSSWHGVLDRSLLTHADLFGFGMGAALILLLWERGLANRIKPVLRRELARPLAYVGLPTIFLGYYLMPPYAYDAAVAFLVAIILLRLLAAKDSSKASATRSRLFLTHRLTIWAGRRSYSVFLWNYPLLAFLSANHLLDSGGGARAFVVNLAIAGPVVAILATFTYRFVEAPALRLKRRRRETVPAVPAVLPAN
jgi:peptidoglycan/LPS O-acetylase OafA/YrhL